MSAQADDGGVSYEELVDLEQEFDDVETEIIRHQYALTLPLYKRRAETFARIPSFWPLVFEAAPPDIDEYIQPSDSALLLSSLNSISVSRFELDQDAKKGDPRSVAIRFEFSENEYFEDKVLEKKFWFRRSGADDWAGLVSEPVDIKWKKDKDLTNGLLGMVRKVWETWSKEADKNGVEKKDAGKKKDKKPLSKDEQALQTQMGQTALGGLSFFAWFGYVGPRVTAQESKAATEKRQEHRKLRSEGKEVPEEDNEEEEDQDMDEDEEDDDDEDNLEIFPDGETLALALSEDLWPNAIKYFTQAQEQAVSDVDFESDLEEGAEGEDGENDGEDGDEAPALKKRKL